MVSYSHMVDDTPITYSGLEIKSTPLLEALLDNKDLRNKIETLEARMKGIITWCFILIPLIAISLIYLEGGLLGVAMYIAYIISTFLTVYLPYVGIQLLRGKSI